MKLFAKGKGPGEPAAQAAAFRPIDRMGLLGLLDQVVNAGGSGVLELHEPRGNWVYAFQGGALTHASGGRVRGARQAFDLLWEFQSGEFTFTQGVNPSLPGNLYIDKTRLLDLLRRSQAVLQSPSAPYIPPGQQRPIAPVPRPYSPPSPAQMPPPWQPAPQQAQPGWPPAGQPPMPQGPAWGPGYPQQPGAVPPGYPTSPYPPQQGQPYPPQGYPPSRGPIQPPAPPMAPQAPAYPGFPLQPQMPSPPPGQAPFAPQAPYAPPAQQPPFAAQPPMAPPAPVRPVTPPSFSVPPMAIPRKQAPVPAYQPPAPAPAAAAAPAPPAPPKDDLAALRASLVSQAPQVRPAPKGPGWNVRTAEGAVAPPPAAGGAKGKAKGKDKGKKGDSKLMALIKLQLIKFLLWACERRYSPDDHWTLKDAFEVSTMELRDQFFGAFTQMLESSKKTKAADDDEMDDMTAGRMRGRGRRH